MTPELFRKLAALGLDNDQMAGVLEIIEADAEGRKEKGRQRWRKWKDGQGTNVSKRLPTTANVSSQLARAEASSSNQETSEKEGKKESTSPPARSTRGTRIPDDFKPDIDAAIADGLSRQEAERQALSFCDYWRAKPGAAALKLDWPATWRMWFRRRLDEKPQSTAPPRRSGVSAAAQRILESEANGSEGVFGDHGNVELLPPAGGGGPRNAVENLQGGIIRQFRAINH